MFKVTNNIFQLCFKNCVKISVHLYQITQKFSLESGH